MPIKEQEDRIALNNGLTIFPIGKGGQKKQSSKVLQFLIMVNRVLMCQTSICALVLLFEFLIKVREDQIALKKGPTISPRRKGDPQ